ncbi:thiamine phosphate synthase [Blautia sp.]|jgi:thiamine-phosphate pyrophosphorylase|uniref:thiamine phosphate synthase n=1 Tax=Blautia sp. TaxID=1955243 RepID=UPI003D8F1EA2
MKFKKEMLLLYAVTDRKWTGEKTLYQQVEEALKGGATLIQLREKNMSQEEFLKEAREITELCHRYGTALIINDNVEVALKSGADGVHVGIEDTPVKEIRKMVPGDFIIGATAKTTEQAQRAEQEGADYIGVGAVFPSPTKKNAIRITLEQLKKISGSVRIPAVAIGGITYENADTLRGGRMAGVAVVSAVFGAADIKKETARLKKKIQETVYL